VSEADLVARMRELFSTRIGDDAAIVGNQVFTNDMLVEDVDFTRAIPLASIAHKSIAVNLSDIAAMGAKPQYLLTALALPEWADANALVEALAASAKRFGVEIIGGDLSRADNSSSRSPPSARSRRARCSDRRRNLASAFISAVRSADRPQDSGSFSMAGPRMVLRRVQLVTCTATSQRLRSAGISNRSLKSSSD
jgi:hypothetical protein